ncbi:MAG TPA: hypothetical protein VF275_01475 [Gammaproteobacteria bacterium]
MKTHFLLRLSLPFLALLSLSANAAYPEGYPRIGPAAQLEIGDAMDAGSFRLIPNPTANEYLAVWESPANVLNALRLDGGALEPIDGQPSFVLLDVQGTNPHHPDHNFGALISYDIAWDSTRNRYFLAVHLTSTHRDGPGGGVSNDTYAGFVQANLETIDLIEFPEMPGCEAMDNSGGLEVVQRPGASGFIYVFRTFGPARPPLVDLLDHDNPVRTSGVCGQIVSGETDSAAAVFIGAPTTVMKLTDIVPGNDLTPFYMTDLAAEFDVTFQHFVLTSTVAEGTITIDPDSGGYYTRQRSDIVGQVVRPGLQTEGGATALRKISAQNHFNDFTIIGTNIQSTPENWTAHSPKLVMGPLNEAITARDWLVTFTGIGPGAPNPLPRRVRELWSHRVSTTNDDVMNAPSGADRLLSDNSRPFSGTDHFVNSQGFWLPEVERFLNVWGSCVIDCYLFGNSLKNTGGNHAAVKNLPLSDGQVSHASAHIVRSLDGESLFTVTSMEDRIEVQEIDLAWMNLSASAEIVGESEIPAGVESILRITVSRSGGVLDGPSDTHPDTSTLPAAVFDSGPYRLHLTMPENLSVTQVDPLLTMGDIETGFSGETAQITLNEGESKTFSFTVRNDNASTTADVDDIHVALESLGDGIEYDASDDTFVVSVTLAGIPQETEPDDNDGNDDTSPLPPPGSDDGGITPAPPSDDTDGDITPPGDDDDEDNAGNTPPGSGGPVGGGGVLGWLLLGLAGFSVRRQRMR